MADRLPTASWTTRQYNKAYQEWKDSVGDDPDAVQALLAEHAELQAAQVKPVRTVDLQKRTSAIATQMGSLVGLSRFLPDLYANMHHRPTTIRWATILQLSVQLFTWAQNMRLQCSLPISNKTLRSCRASE